MNKQDVESLPAAVVDTRSGLSVVWLVPLVALLIGIWLAYQTWSEMGPMIAITFKTAAGLEAGKTKIKYKNVEIGQVKTIELSNNLSHVIVTVSLVKGAKHYLKQSTRFWVVRARIAAGKVSGLDTVLSGAYIGIDPGKTGKNAEHFTGLEAPPVVTHDAPGGNFLLRADSLGSLDVGSPVYYRMIKVGKVTGYQFSSDGKSIEINLFVHSPHDKQITRNTHFWNASGLDLSFDASGLRVSTESLITILMGGIAFETPEDDNTHAPLVNKHEFVLFKDYATSKRVDSRYNMAYVLYFPGSVRGLNVGAPVELRGIKIGIVTDINMKFNAQSNNIKIPVTIKLVPSRVLFKDASDQAELVHDHRRIIMDKFVAQGMRAQLKTGNYMTGQLFIDLDFIPNTPVVTINWNNTPPVFPTTATPFEELSNTLVSLLEKLKNLPLQDIGRQFHETATSLTVTIRETEKLVRTLNSFVTPAITATLKQAQQTLATVDNTLQSDVPMQHDLQDVFSELSKAARSIRTLADYLERHPDALIYGKQEK